MMRHISISVFINTVFIVAFSIITFAFVFFVKLDQEHYETSQQQRYELIAEAFLTKFKSFPSGTELKEQYAKYEVTPVENREFKLSIINHAELFYQRESLHGRLRVFQQRNNFFIYVQQLSYNVMLKDLKPRPYNTQIALFIYIASIFTFLFLYFVLRRKLTPLKRVHKRIQLFSQGKTDIKIGFHTNDEIGRIAKSFDDAILYINNLSESKNLFMRNMMHELKTPIAKGMIIAETLPDELTDKKILQNAFERMNDIIKELATVERVTSHMSTIHKENIDIKTLYLITLKLMLLKEENIHFKIENFEIEADCSLFPIALKNLLDNGIKFSEDKQVTLTGNKKEIQIISKGERLKHNLDYYTQPFSQEEKRSDGFGLGLYLVKTILQLHDFKLDYAYIGGRNCFKIICENQ